MTLFPYLNGIDSRAALKKIVGPVMNTLPRLCLVLTLLATTGLALLVPPSTAQSGPAEARCPATPLEDRLPSVIAPMAGRHPVWLVNASRHTWRGPDVRIKTAWVVARDALGDLVLRGRQRDGTGVLGFQRGEHAPLIYGELVLARSSMPRAAATGAEQHYAFVVLSMVYPAPGCWELTARLGEAEVQIIVSLKAEPGEY